MYTGLRDINPIWDVLLPRLVKKVVEWRDPDSPFWAGAEGGAASIFVVVQVAFERHA